MIIPRAAKSPVWWSRERGMSLGKIRDIGRRWMRKIMWTSLRTWHLILNVEEHF